MSSDVLRADSFIVLSARLRAKDGIRGECWYRNRAKEDAGRGMQRLCEGNSRRLAWLARCDRVLAPSHRWCGCRPISALAAHRCNSFGRVRCFKALLAAQCPYA